MEQQLKDYIEWYKTEKNEFNSRVYIDRSTWLKRKLSPYSDWDSVEVLEKESEFTLKAIAELANRNFSESSISLAALTLSNRVEYISDQSDFYVTYAALMIFSLAVMSLSMGLLMELAITFMVFGGVGYSFTKRLDLRKQVAISKEIINIFKQYEVRHATQKN